LHVLLYLTPGAALLTLAAVLIVRGRYAASDEGAPRWARWFARVAITLIVVGGIALLGLGGVVSAVLLRG
jgi:hypothetical protein